MNRSVRVVMVLLLLVFAVQSGFSAGIVFGDSKVEKEVRSRLGAGPGAVITPELMKGVRALTLEGVRSLKGLEHAVNLTYMFFYSCPDASLYQQLGNLKSLQVLEIYWGRRVTDFSFLRRLPALRRLAVTQSSSSGNNPFDFRDLTANRRLQKLTLQGFKITGMDAAGPALSGLEVLQIKETVPLKDIRFLRHYKGLKELMLIGLRSKDLSPLAQLTGLQSLWISCEGRTGSADFLRSLTKLKKLALLGIHDTAGLRYLRNLSDLEELQLIKLGLRNLDMLRGMTGLVVFNGDNNVLTDISGLKGCTELKSLSLYKNALRDISPLEGLTKLQTVYLQQNKIKDFTPLFRALNRGPGKRVLSVRHNGADFRPSSANFRLYKQLNTYQGEYRDGNYHSDGQIFAAEDLEKKVRSMLNIASGPIPESRLRTIRELRFGSGDFCQLGGVEKLSSLEKLAVGIFVNDLEPLKNLVSLKSIDLAKCKVDSVRHLRRLTKVTDLFLHGNPLYSLDGLQGMRALEQLTLWETRVSDLSPLRGLVNLRNLKMGYMPASDLAPLAGLAQLVNLTAPGMEISTLEPLRNLKNLKRLNISRNRVRDLTPLRGLKALYDNDFSHNPLSSLEPLLGWKQDYYSLDVSYTKIPMREIYRYAVAKGARRGELKFNGNGYNFAPGSSDYQYLQQLQRRFPKIKLEYREGNSVTGDADSGKKALNFTLQNQDGTPLSLRTLRGKLVLLEFSAGWCRYCHQQAAYMAEVKRRLQAQGIKNFETVVVLSQDAKGASPSRTELQSWARRYGLSHVVADPDGKVGRRMQIGSLPYNILILPNGNISAVWAGAYRDADALIMKLKSCVPAFFSGAPVAPDM